MAETLILDPTSEDAANAQLDITGTGYGLIEHHYPQPPVAAQWASSVDTEGSRLGSVKHENRQIQIVLDVDGLTALRALQAKLGKLHREGGTFKRTLSDATVIVFDVLTVEGYDPEFSYSFDMATVTQVSFTLTCLPYGRAPEVDMGDNVETTLPWLIFTDTGVKGDMPGLGRLIVDNDQAPAVSQSFLLWGIQSQYYSSASTAALFYQAESCALLTATSGARAGASGGSAAGRTTLTGSGFFDGLIYLGASSTAQTHIGTFRLFARVQAPSANTGSISMRATYSPIVGAATVTNDSVTLSDQGVDSWEVVDLGMLTLPKNPRGTQGWIGRVEAAASVAGEDVYVDWIALLPATEGTGEVTHGDGISPRIPIGQSVEVAADGVRVSSTGGYWAKPDRYEGDYLRVPPAGAEARTVRVMAKFMREPLGTPVTGSGFALGDFIDDLSARLYVTPRYLVVPSA